MGKDFCGICEKLIKNNSNSIFCDYCESWIHPKCNLLNHSDFLKLSKQNETWSCLKCNSETLPFCSFSPQSSENSLNCSFYSNLSSNLVENNPSLLLTENDEPDSDKIDCRYFDCKTLNSTISDLYKQDLQISISFFHLNSNSLHKHFDDISNLLDSLLPKFKVLGFSETRILNSSYSIPNFENFTTFSNPTDSSAGGTAIFVSNSLQFYSRDDLSTTLYPKI